MDEKRRRAGRQPLCGLGEQPAKVNLSLAPADYDRVHDVARREAISVPEVIRRSIRRVLEDDGEK